MSDLGGLQDRAFGRLRAALRHPRAGLASIAIGVALVAPSLAVGLQADDHWHRLMLVGDGRFGLPRRPPLSLFAFFPGDPRQIADFVEAGVAIWWSHPWLKASFARPLSALTHALDWAAWPDVPVAMHAHSLAWYALVLAAALAAYRRVLPARPGLAALAMLAYAIDCAHAAPVGWIANRNALVATAPALAALALHAENVARPRAYKALGAALALAVGLAGGETALGAFAFLAAHALVLERDAWRARLARLAPYALVLAAWAALYRAGGYGAAHSGMYADPGREPLRFAASALRTAPLVFGAALGLPAPDGFLFLPEAARTASWVSVTALVVGIVALVLRHARARAEARFFLVGGVLALAPMSATFPHSRLLLLPGFGLSGLVASYLEATLDGELFAPEGRLARFFAVGFARWLAFARFALSPLLAVPLSCQMMLFGQKIDRLADGLGDDASLASQRLVLVNSPDAVFTPYLSVVRAARGRVAPRALFTLATGARDLDVEAADASTLVVRVPSGFYTYGTETLMRAVDEPMPVGTRVVTSEVSVEVLEATPRGVPTAVSFHFSEPLASPAFRFVAWKDATLVPFALPARGEHVRIAGQNVLR